MGVFIGIFPTFGFGTFFILALVPLWRFTIPVAFVGTLVGNPALALIWISIIGSYCTGITQSSVFIPRRKPFSEILTHYGALGVRFLKGNTVWLLLATVSYFIVKHFVVRFHLRKRAHACIEHEQRKKADPSEGDSIE